MLLTTKKMQVKTEELVKTAQDNKVMLFETMRSRPEEVKNLALGFVIELGIASVEKDDGNTYDYDYIVVACGEAKRLIAHENRINSQEIDELIGAGWQLGIIESSNGWSSLLKTKTEIIKTAVESIKELEKGKTQKEVMAYYLSELNTISMNIVKLVDKGSDKNDNLNMGNCEELVFELLTHDNITNDIHMLKGIVGTSSSNYNFTLHSSENKKVFPFVYKLGVYENGKVTNGHEAREFGLSWSYAVGSDNEETIMGLINTALVDNWEYLALPIGVMYNESFKAKYVSRIGVEE